jgi:hypothetical protein
VKIIGGQPVLATGGYDGSVLLPGASAAGNSDQTSSKATLGFHLG